MKSSLIRMPVCRPLRTALWAALGTVCFASAPALAQTGRAAGPTMCACPGVHKPLGNNATCEEACYGSSSGGGSGDYSGAEEAGRQARRWVDCKLFGKGCPDQTDGRRDVGRDFNELGVQAYNKGDWTTAISLFQQALQNSPDDPVIRKNLANAQTNLANQQARERAEKEAMERQRQNKVAADNMQQSIQNFAQTLNAAPVSGGLDFDLRDAPNSPSKAGSGSLDFTASVAAPSRPSVSGDPKVVDARVPRDGAHLTDQVPELKNSPAADRISKGFQAVIKHDWLAALAWWQDALNRDPNNAALKRSVELAQWMVDKRKARAAGPATPLGAAIHSASRKDYAGAMRQFELVKKETPAIASQVDDMINALRQRQAKEANDAKVAAYWSGEIKKQTQRLVDDLIETGMNRLSVGDEKGAQDAFRDADFYSMGLPAGDKSQLPAPKLKSAETRSRPEEGILDRAKRVARETRDRDPQTKEKLKRMPKHGDSVGGKPSADEVTLGGKG